MKPRKRFPPHVYAAIIQRQGGLCACQCGETLQPGQIDYDHERELWDGGEDTPENLRALVRKHHLKKTAEQAKRRAKLVRIKAKFERRLSARDREIARIIERKRGRHEGRDRTA